MAVTPARRPIQPLAALPLAALVALAACAPPATGGDELDLGDLGGAGKADAVEVQIPFTVAAGQEVVFRLRTAGRLFVDTDQETDERLQLIAESTVYRRRSWRGRAPFLRIHGAETGGDLTAYELTLHSWGGDEARGVLRVTTDEPDPPGVELVANDPDCDGCERPAGELRRTILDAIQSARASIDLAVYGLDDPAIVEALCHAAEAGVRVRVVADGSEVDEGEAYHDALMNPESGLLGCGVPVEIVDYAGIMHNKLYVIDAGTDSAVLLTGSANQTERGFDVNHNHALVVRGAPELTELYVREFEQLFTHCVANGCDECTPACTADLGPPGPYAAGEAHVQAFFSPADDLLRALRGEVRVERREEPDPACGPGTDCLCTASGSSWRCEYCAQGADGWGALEGARERVLISTFVLTDECLALGVGRAAARGVRTAIVYDEVNAASPYSQDEVTCAMGVPSWLSEWGDGSSQARNHHKLLVLDDALVSGSTNFSRAGVDRNHENSLWVQDAALADAAAEIVGAQIRQLTEIGARPGCRE